MKNKEPKRFCTVYIREFDKLIIKRESSNCNMSMAEFINYLVNDWMRRK